MRSIKSNPGALRIWILFFPYSSLYSPKIIQNSPHLVWVPWGFKSVEDFVIPKIIWHSNLNDSSREIFINNPKWIIKEDFLINQKVLLK